MDRKNKNDQIIEKVIIDKVLWSITLPGLSAIKWQYIKGLLYIFLEFLINIQSYINQIIKLSFQGKIHNEDDRKQYLEISAVIETALFIS